MEEETEEEGCTLTSFEPLSPEDETSGLRKFLKGFYTRKKWRSASLTPEGQDGLERSTQNTPQVYVKSDIVGKERLSQGHSNPGGLYSKEDKPHFSQSKIRDRGQGEIVESRHSRTPSSVLRRLSQLVLLEKAYPLQSQGTDNLKKYWMPDEQCKVCYECGVKFNTFRRRHHCRLCGQIFCSRCCNEVVSGHQIGYTGVFRVCIYCKKIVLTYTSSSDIEKNLKQLKEDLSLLAQPDSSSDPELNRFFDVLGVSAEEASMLKQDSLKDLWQAINTPRTGLEFSSHRLRLRTYSSCFLGRDLMNWLMINRKASNRTVALQICQGLQDFGWIEPLSARDPGFKDDFVLYIPGPRASGEIYYSDLRSPSLLKEMPSSQGNDLNDSFSERFYRGKREPVSCLSASFDQSIVEGRRDGFHKSNSTSKIIAQDAVSATRARSLSCENIMAQRNFSTGNKQSPLHKGESKIASAQSPSTQSPGLEVFVNVEDCYLPKGQVSEQASEDTGTQDDVNEETTKNDTITAKDLRISSSEESDERDAFEKLSAIHDKHISAFLVQLLERVGLSQSWKDVIEPLAVNVCQMVLPDVENDEDMDIRRLVKIKKIPGGLRSDCRIVHGVVCTKNVVHKKMAPSITQPRILMLACPVDFQRVENKMASLDSLVLQEEEFLKNMVGRIAALHPSLVLVEKTVSRLAQERLLARGISVILNIKPQLMERISRCVEGDVLPSLDQGSRPKLGVCKKFKIEKFVFKNGSTKTMAFFEGCNPQHGGTIVLRGANRKELTKVRNVLSFMLFVAYNSRLEKAFIMDEFGTPLTEETRDDNDEGPADDSSPPTKVTFTVEGENEEDETGSKTEVFSTTEACESLLEDSNEEECKNVDKNETSLGHVASSKIFPHNQNCHSNSQKVVGSDSFQHILDNIVLCASPLVKFPLPYILTPEGKLCELRTFMNSDMYWSALFFGDSSVDRSSSDEEEEEVDNAHDKAYENVIIKRTHPFVFAVLEKDARDLKALGLLANYRAEGGKITLRKEEIRDSLDEGSFSTGSGSAFDESGGINSGSKVHARRRKDKFVPTITEESTRGNECEANMLPLRDCFDPFLHQMIAVSFSSYSRDSGNFPNPCITPWTVFMEFYARNDITLGCFLERYCFRSSYVCPNPNCDVPMVKHVRYFAHGDGAVYINMKNLESPIPGFSKTLLTWSWCKQCKQVTPIVPVSPEAWRLSFAKYLELRIYATCYRRRATEEPCDHSLHQDHYQYFALNNIVASLKHVPVKIYEVYLPLSTITIIEEERQPQFWIKHIQAMSARVYQLINLINDRIAALKTEAYICDCVTDIACDKGQLHEKIKVLESKAMLLLNPPSSPGDTTNNKLLEPHEVATVEYEILDGITLLKRMMCEHGEKWNAKLVELLQLENKREKNKSMEGKNSILTESSNTSPIETSQMTDDSVFSNSTTAPQQDNTGFQSLPQYNPFNPENYPCTDEPTDDNPTGDKAGQNASVHQVSQGNGFSDSSNTSEQGTLDDDLGSQHGFNNSCCNQKFQKHSKLWATLTEEVNSTLKDVQYVEDRPGPKVKRIFTQFLPGVSFRPIPSPFPVHEHHLLPVSEVIPVVVNEKEPTSIIAYTLSCPDYQKKLLKIQESIDGDSESFTCVEVETDAVSSRSERGRSRTRARSEVETLSSSSLMTALGDDFVENYFQWSELGEDDVEDKDLAKKANSNKPEHMKDREVSRDDDKCCKVEFVRNDSKISEDDPKEDGLLKTEDMEGSVSRPQDKNDEANSSREKDVGKSTEELNADGKDSMTISSSENVEYHIKHSFSDSSAKFFCVVYFGEQFRRIRKAVFPGGEEKYIRSLQYCLKWNATGGKSGSLFCKTTDDRFVIKEMSRPEAHSFLNIAPYYFQYIEKTIEEKKPTLLAKIVGVYRIGCNSKLTNTPIRRDLLVMENLFYNSKVDKVFDLKGSIRSRYVLYQLEKDNHVLMDENMLEMIAESPLFIRPHSRAVLNRAINNDTEFLAKHMVMDYSLLLGIERDSFKLIVGIIDFIRTFTWDKKLEMYVKSTGILGGQGKMPTVVSPELYRERFCQAMQRYFSMIPDKWIGLGNESK